MLPSLFPYATISVIVIELQSVPPIVREPPPPLKVVVPEAAEPHLTLKVVALVVPAAM